MKKIKEKYDHNHDILINDLVQGLGIPHIIARILAARGFSTPEEAETFLFPKLTDLSDPFLIPDVEKGIHVLLETIKKKGKICLFGDYDSDGITSCALMYNFLRHINQQPSVYIPDRREGYGLNIEAVKRLKKEGIELIICLDCGSSNQEEIRLANELGMSVMVIDHHEVPHILPPAEALINPKRHDSSFRTRELAACGVTFFFLWALRRVIHERGMLKEHINLKNELDLVTLGTIGDMVPLLDDNRILTKIGIETMRKKPRQWLKTFYKENMIPRSELNEFALNFIIIPRINAAGRVTEPEEAFDFLVSQKEAESIRLLSALNYANNLRQQIGDRILKECRDEIEQTGMNNKNSIVLFKRDWHIGVIGIVAQRLTEIYGKPSLVMTEVNGICKGSGRGTEHIHLYDTLTSISHMLIRFGGHRFACGFSIERDNIKAFKNAFDNLMESRTISTPKEYVFDTKADFEELTPDFVSLLETMSPFGIGNPRPAIMLQPMDIALVNKNRIKIIDRNMKSWFGYIQNSIRLPEDRIDNLKIIVDPMVKEEMGSKFLNLNLRAIII
ncbi:MAG TPA: single-stranded-DNA-specific exonuclease RecJ [Syntrophorhabdaceae bacterium]|nr:single-stranded-DNA-specific exonuclease RecJ [Syntrophorhabdaceae bacterium]